ncbi:ClpP/crotonase-like domain-containing protein [Phlyctochytrium arcticum]|nr:ClpP/crotonase-like domain-containing protein [Phlyctochytrium arcticum]
MAADDLLKPYSAFTTVKASFASDHVLHVALNRPAELNNMPMEFWEEFRQVFEIVRQDSNVRCVVISGGECRIFTAGLDLMSFAPVLTGSSSGPKDPAREALKFMNLVTMMQNAFTAIEDCYKPVISAVHGACIGAGVDLITACDIRYASSDAFFSIKEIDIGLAADVGTLQRIGKIVGNESWVREIAFTARNVPAAEGLQFGLFSKILPRESLLDEALKTAKIIAAKSPVAALSTKHILNHARDHSVKESLHYVGMWNSVMTNTQDLPIAVKASMSKKTPVFPKL